MMLRNQSSSSTQPLGHSLTKPINSVGAKNYNSTISNQQASGTSPGAGAANIPGSSHGAGVGANNSSTITSQHLNENNQNIANQKNFN